MSMVCTECNTVQQTGIFSCECHIEKELLRVKDYNEKFNVALNLKDHHQHFISEYFDDLTRQVDLRREQIIEALFHSSERILSQIDSYKREALKKESFSASNLCEKKIVAFKKTLDTVNTMCDIKDFGSSFSAISGSLPDQFEALNSLLRLELIGMKYLEFDTKSSPLDLDNLQTIHATNLFDKVPPKISINRCFGQLNLTSRLHTPQVSKTLLKKILFIICLLYVFFSLYTFVGTKKPYIPSSLLIVAT
jgi:hypothetical protein